MFQKNVEDEAYLGRTQHSVKRYMTAALIQSALASSILRLYQAGLVATFDHWKPTLVCKAQLLKVFLFPALLFFSSILDPKQQTKTTLTS